MRRPRTQLRTTVLGAPDPAALASFYERLLGYERIADRPDWVVIRQPDGDRRLAFQPEPDHERPVWPAAVGAQQMQLHLDVAVDDLDDGVAWACEAGAVLAEHQPQDDVRVLLDPAGHPFCLFALDELRG